MSFTREQIRKNNERLRIESLALAALSSDERRRHMAAKRAGKPLPENEPENDHSTRPKIPDSEQRECQKELGRSDAREAQVPRRFSGSSKSLPYIVFILWRVNLLDADACYSSVKDALDCCWRCGIGAGDRPDQITLEVRQEKVAHYKDEFTEIVIYIPDL